MNIDRVTETGIIVSPRKTAKSDKDDNTDGQDIKKLDELDISAIASKITAELGASSELSMIDTEKVNAITKELSDGTYKLDPIEIAKKMIDIETGNLDN